MSIQHRYARLVFLSLCLIAAIAGALFLRARQQPDVILVVLDTVRADHLSGWGYPHLTSPNLDELLASATQYKHAQSVTSWTLPAHGSMFTGLLPFQHGAHARGYIDKEGLLQVYEFPLADEHVTLAERLKNAGYATGGFCANIAFLSPRWNMQQGFDIWATPDTVGIPGIEIVKHALEWFEENSGKPRFLFVNLMDAHRPYNITPVDFLYGEDVSKDGSLLDRLREQMLPGDKDAEPELVEKVVRQYDTGIANADRALGQLLNALRESGEFNDALIIVTSDHGEFLGEHRLAEHSKDIYESALHVPLVVKHPGQQTSSVNDIRVSIGQVFASVLDRTRVQRPVDVLPPLPDAANPPQSTDVFAELYYSRIWDVNATRDSGRFERIRTVLYRDDWKYIHSTNGTLELYRLDADPDEDENLIGSEAQTAEALNQSLRQYRELDLSPAVEAARVEPTQLSPEEEERMRNLGYL